MKYIIDDPDCTDTFPDSLAGLTAAIAQAREFAYAQPVPVLKVAEPGDPITASTLAYIVPVTRPKTPRMGYA